MPTPRQERYELLISHLLAGRSYSAIAMLMSVSRKQLYVWLKRPDFQVLYAETKRDILTGIKDSVIGGACEGMQLIRDVATDVFIPKIERFEVAKYLVDNALKFAEAVNTDNEDEQLIPVKRSGSNE